MKSSSESITYLTNPTAELANQVQPFVVLDGTWSQNQDQLTIIATNPIAEMAVYQCNPEEHLTKLEKILKLIGPNQLFGFFSYDFGNQLQKITKQNKSNAPLSYWLLPKEIQIHNHTKKTATKINFLITEKNLSELKELFSSETRPKSKYTATNKLTSNISETEYKETLSKIKTAIINGQTYQVNFAQKFSQKNKISAVSLFNKIKAANPSPYQTLISTSNFNIISNSPELLISKFTNELITKPIKGTSKNKTTLTKSQKDTAELNMIVDLSRNDIGKISRTGSVKVKNHRQILKLQHIFHTFSTITGTAKANLKLSQLIKAIFPGGSITGCPKLRTMKIIKDLERSPRGIYCGSAGFLSGNGDLVLNIMIRTIWKENANLSMHAGGGIVIDSNQDQEYQETFNKAQSFIDLLTNE